MVEAGATLREIGDRFGFTHQNAQLICARLGLKTNRYANPQRKEQRDKSAQANAREKFRKHFLNRMKNWLREYGYLKCYGECGQYKDREEFGASATINDGRRCLKCNSANTKKYDGCE
jgi:hypothetical protein